MNSIDSKTFLSMEDRINDLCSQFFSELNRGLDGRSNALEIYKKLYSLIIQKISFLENSSMVNPVILENARNTFARMQIFKIILETDPEINFEYSTGLLGNESFFDEEIHSLSREFFRKINEGPSAKREALKIYKKIEFILNQKLFFLEAFKYKIFGVENKVRHTNEMLKSMDTYGKILEDEPAESFECCVGIYS